MSTAGLRLQPQSKYRLLRRTVFSPVSRSISTSEHAMVTSNHSAAKHSQEQSQCFTCPMSTAGLRLRPQSKKRSLRKTVFSPVSRSISTSENAAPKEVYFRGMELCEPAKQVQSKPKAGPRTCSFFSNVLQSTLNIRKELYFARVQLFQPAKKEFPPLAFWRYLQ